jgi:hypothetical protein
MSIAEIAFRVGGQRVLDAMGDESGTGTDLLRDAITSYAAEGNATVVNDTIVSLFGSASSLSDEQLGELGDALVENYQP